MTQKQRVLALLRQRAHHGLTAADFAVPVVDGGQPIFRVASRIKQLRDEGCQITSTRLMSGLVRYELVGEPAAEATTERPARNDSAKSKPRPAPTSPLSSPPAPDTLFNPADVNPPRNAVLQDFEKDAA